MTHAAITVQSCTQKLGDWHSATVWLSQQDKYQARFALRQMNNQMGGYLRRASICLTYPVVADLLDKCVSADVAINQKAQVWNWYKHQVAGTVTAEEKAAVLA